MKWKYEKACGHHHVILPDGEVLDVQKESYARLIASIPLLLKRIKELEGFVKKLRSDLSRLG